MQRQGQGCIIARDGRRADHIGREREFPRSHLRDDGIDDGYVRKHLISIMQEKFESQRSYDDDDLDITITVSLSNELRATNVVTFVRELLGFQEFTVNGHRLTEVPGHFTPQRFINKRVKRKRAEIRIEDQHTGSR